MKLFKSIKLVLATMFIVNAVCTKSKESFNKIGIKFFVITNNRTANDYYASDKVNQIILNLNKAFKDDSGLQIVTFFSKGITKFEDLKEIDCDILKYGTHINPPNKMNMIKSFMSCKNPKLRDRQSINFYIFDSPWQKNIKWKTSYSYFNGEQSPAVLVNWETLKTGYKSPSIHEIGHIFGLGHSKACGANDDTPTYAMATPNENCGGTGGNRKLGFTNEEKNIIKENVIKVSRSFSR